jgi:Tol biopolymer transport system component
MGASVRSAMLCRRLLLSIAIATAGLSWRVSSAEMISPQAGAQSVTISTDGRFMAFQENGNVYRRDRQTSSSVLLSVPDGPGTANAPSGLPLMSADGRYVFFTSYATNLVTNVTFSPGTYNIFRRDVVTGTTVVASASAGQAANQHAGGGGMAITPDGRFIVFESPATNLVADVAYPTRDGNPLPNIFVRDMVSGELDLVTRSADGATASNLSMAGHGGAFSPVISNDGRYVAFISYSTNLVAGVQFFSGSVHSPPSIFLRDRFEQRTRILSASPGGAYASNGACSQLAMNADGRYVAYVCAATNIVGGHTYSEVGGGHDPAFTNLYVWDRAVGVNSIASRNAAGNATANSGVSYPSLSADGRYLAFLSGATNLDTSVQYVTTPVVGGTPIENVFVYDMSDGVVDLVSRSADDQSGSNASAFPTAPAISGDGHRISYATWATNMADGNYRDDCAESPTYLVLLDRDAAQVDVSASSDGCAQFFPPALSQDGKFIAVSTDTGVYALPDWVETPSAPKPSDPDPNAGTSSGGGGGKFDGMSLLCLMLFVALRGYINPRRTPSSRRLAG